MPRTKKPARKGNFKTEMTRLGVRYTIVRGPGGTFQRWVKPKKVRKAAEKP